MATKTLILNQEYIIENTIISDSIDFNLLKPQIIKIQDFKLKELLGSDLFDEIMLQTSTVPDTLSDENKILVNDYILPMLSWYLVAACCMSMKFRITAAGVMVNSTENSQSGETSDLQIMEKRYSDDGATYGNNMVKYLIQNKTLYPKLATNIGVDKTQPAKSGFSIGLYLDDCL